MDEEESDATTVLRIRAFLKDPPPRGPDWKKGGRLARGREAAPRPGGWGSGLGVPPLNFFFAPGRLKISVFGDAKNFRNFSKKNH